MKYRLRHFKWTVALGTTLSVIISCSPQDIERPGPTGQKTTNKSKSSNISKKVVSGTDPSLGSSGISDSDPSTSQPPSDQNITQEGGGTGTGTSTGTTVTKTTPAPTAAPIVYPSVAFAGGGYTTSQADNKHVPTTMKLAAFLDTPLLRLVTTEANIDCKPLHCGDSDQSNGNAKIQDRVIGNVDYLRPSTAQIASYKAAGFVDAPYAIFANKVRKTKPNGTLVSEVTFDKPLPVYPWPAPASRYNSLQGEATWSAHAVDDKGQSYTVIATIKNKTIVGDYLAVTFDFTIPEDGDTYRFYKDSPLPKSITFQMNSRTKDMCQILQMRSLLIDSDNRKQEMDMAFSIYAKRLNNSDNPYVCLPQKVEFPK